MTPITAALFFNQTPQMFFVNGVLFDKNSNASGYVVTGIDADAVQVNGLIFVKNKIGEFVKTASTKRDVTVLAGDVYDLQSIMNLLVSEVSQTAARVNYAAFSMYVDYNGKTYRVSDHDSYNSATKRGLKFKLANNRLTLTFPNLVSIIIK
jgi:hypothetical protein